MAATVQAHLVGMEERVETLLDVLGGVDAWALYALVAVLVLGESAAVALLLPGELALVVAGALSARGQASLPVMIAVAIAAAVCGHAAGYELGRRHGLRLLRRPILRRYADAVERASALVVRHGGVAVFLGRWMNVGRFVVPLLVGAGHMRYRTFTLYNVLGGVAWVLTFVLIGAAAGASLDAVERAAGEASWYLTALVAVGLAGAWARRRAGRGGHRVAGRCDIDSGEVVGCRSKLESSPRSSQRP